MGAGDLQVALPSNLSDDLLGQQFTMQIENPEVDQAFFLIGFSRWDIELVDVYLRSIGGEVQVQITIDDVVVSFAEGTTNAVVLTSMELLAREGQFEQYVADEPLDNKVIPGAAVKMIITDIPTDTGTAGQTLLADFLFRRVRNDMTP